MNLSRLRIPSLTDLFCSRNINVNASANVGSGAKEGNSPRHAWANEMRGESKLELFGFDYLVNILGLKIVTAYNSCSSRT